MQNNLSLIADGNTLANFSDDEDDPREQSHSPSKKLKKSNSFNGSTGKVEPKSLNAPPMPSNNSLEYITSIIHSSVQSNSATHGNGTPNSIAVSDASNGANANHLSAFKNSLTNGPPIACSSICGNSALSRDELREQIEHFSKAEIRACLQKIFHEKYALYCRSDVIFI